MAGAVGGIVGGVGGGIAGGYFAKKAAEEQASASRYGADVQGRIAKRQFEAEQALTPLQIQQQQQLAESYRGAYGQAQEQYGAGEEQLAELFSRSPEELEQLKESIYTGQAKQLQQGAGQLQAGLAQAGVRGGQAATQMRRGIGEMTETAGQNIQDLISQEAMGRAGEQRQYMAGQQAGRQQFLLDPTSAQYSQEETPEEAAYREAQLRKFEQIDNNNTAAKGSSLDLLARTLRR